MKGGAIRSVGSRDFAHTNMRWRQNCSVISQLGFSLFSIVIISPHGSTPWHRNISLQTEILRRSSLGLARPEQKRQD